MYYILYEGLKIESNEPVYCTVSVSPSVYACNNVYTCVYMYTILYQCVAYVFNA